MDVSKTTFPENIALEPTGPERTSPVTAAEESPEAEESGEPVGKSKASDKADKGGQSEDADSAGDEGGGRSPSATRARRR